MLILRGPALAVEGVNALFAAIAGTHGLARALLFTAVPLHDGLVRSGIAIYAHDVGATD